MTALLPRLPPRDTLALTPQEMTSEQLREKLVSAGAVGLQEVDIVVDKATGAGKGFGFLEFYNYAAADSLRRKLTRTEMK